MSQEIISTPSPKGGRNLVLRLKAPLLIFFVALFLYFLAGRMDNFSVPGQLGPFFWPKAILIFLMISCGIKGLEIAFSPSPGPGSAASEISRPDVHYPRLIYLIALVLGVVLATQTIGFPLANFFFLWLFMFAAGMRQKLYLLTTSLIGTIILLYLFVKVVYLPLPRGYWFFEDLTLFFYRILRII